MDSHTAACFDLLVARNLTKKSVVERWSLKKKKTEPRQTSIMTTLNSKTSVPVTERRTKMTIKTIRRAINFFEIVSINVIIVWCSD